MRRTAAARFSAARLSTAAAKVPTAQPPLHLLSPMTNLAAQRSAEPLRIVRGAGVRVFDDHGRDYLEAMAGLWCTSLGWGNDELADAAAEQMRQLSYYHGFTGRLVPPAEELAAALVDLAPTAELRADGRVFFGQSGSDANDTQVRLLWHYNHAIGRPRKRKIISRKRGYHGVTIAAGSLTGLPYVHAAQGLPLDFVPQHVSCPSFYREGLPGETEAEFVARLAAELDAAIEAEGGAEEVAGFIAEPLQGAGGVVLPPPGYFAAVRAVLQKHNVLMIGDEVITGFGRTGAFWGGEHAQLEQRADLISSAKQLTSGYLPLSAVLLPGYMFDAMAEHTATTGSVFGHGYTYTSHPVACALSLKVLGIMERECLVERVEQTLGPHMQARLSALGDHALVGESRGVGLIGAVELVECKATRRSFDPVDTVSAKVVAAALKRGLIVRALSQPDVVAICPPLIISPSEIDEVFDKLESALDEVAAQVL